MYLSRYAEGEVLITQMADGPGTPPVREWVDFRAAAHASAVGKCLLTQLDHDGRADHVARHRPARLTPRTITDSRTLFSALDAVAPGAPRLRPAGVLPRRRLLGGAPHHRERRRVSRAVPARAARAPAAARHGGAATQGRSGAAGAAADGHDPAGDRGARPGEGPRGHPGGGARTGSAAGRGHPGDPAASAQAVPYPLTRASAAAPGGRTWSATRRRRRPTCSTPSRRRAAGSPWLALPRTFAPLRPGSLPTPDGLVVLGTT
ncbi:hypothetical protein GCM10020254_20400 [Streptomyces goshikiensis]